MSTRSRYGYMDENGKVISVYCHFDGYPSEVGRILNTEYNTLKKVRDLVSLGNASYLSEGGLDKCCFYCRDRSESFDDNEPWEESLENTLHQEEYHYIFVDGKWFLYRSVDDFEPLENVIKGDE